MGFVISFLFLFGLPAGAASRAAPEEVAPSTPREFFNAGTRKLSEGKLGEAEALLESALASQIEQLQPPALYNLGHVRFKQGAEELKKGPATGPTLEGGRAAGQSADEAIRTADDALARGELQELVGAYLRGRGARKELKAATLAVKHALEAHRATLAKWQLATDDFKSTGELSGADADARHNAEVVDRCIAKLVDSVQALQQCMNGLGEKQGQLGQRMKALRGRIPAPNMPPGAAGDDEEDDDGQPLGVEPGQKEGPSKDGEEMRLSAEQAGWLLDAFKLDAERRLPMGGQEPADTGNRSRPTW